MAMKIPSFKRSPNCTLCSRTFRKPVSLSCNHSFCSSCLQNFWEISKNKKCPICKRKSSKEDLFVNFKLEELSGSFSGMMVRPLETEKKKTKVKVAQREQEKESESLSVSDLKEQLKSDLKPLLDKWNKCKQVEKTYNEMIEHSKKQLLSTETQIRAEFNKLHQFLKEEEESRLTALREEEEQKRQTISREMKRIQEQISSLSASISDIEIQLHKDSWTFLSSYKSIRARARVQCSQSDPQLVSGALIDVAKHLGNLCFRVWEKMKDRVHFSPVILDPNTAHSCLYLSDDLTSVRQRDKYQQLPDNPERHTNKATVLGSEGFSSGKHSWEVEVGDHPEWNVGLAKESADRKGVRFASPEWGLWCLCNHSGKCTNGLGETVTVKSLHRLGVQLNYERGLVSFYDPDDMTLIYTYRDTFTETLFPYFSIGPSGDAKTHEVIMCHSEISVTHLWLVECSE